MPDVVFTADCEAFQLAVRCVAFQFGVVVLKRSADVRLGDWLCDESAVEIGESDAHGAAFDGCLAEHGAGMGAFSAVCFGECDGSESFARCFLVSGVDVVGFADVDEDSLSRVREFECFGLGISEFSPCFGDVRVVVFSLVVCQLAPVEGEVRLLEDFSPDLDELWEFVFVFFRSVGV